MIPISDDNPSITRPYVNWALIALCIGVFLWELSLGQGGADAAGDLYGFAPASLLHPTKVARLPGELPPYLTIFTSMFLHGGLLHIAGNMLYLWIFGNNIEDAMGHVKYLVFYLLCGIAAAVSFAAMDPASHMPMIGASGAISGVLAAYVLLFPRARVTVIIPLGIIFYPIAISAVWVVGVWFILQLVSAALSDPSQPGTAWWAHVGGFALGLVLTPLFKSANVPLFGRYPRSPWT
ncbi:MAG TPA: rhomboid family intramembrane serine protease [Rhizomicrobium sp.]|jgi:membrane associated rhomboid family serine protease|nr:rhomboid family intramembrane serine protease [Rhizomicrobium sp.]